MSITSRINEMSSHIEQAYDELQGLGADLTNVNKNIENISIVLDDIYDSMPQVSGEGTSLTLDNTRVGKIKSTLKGNTSQSGTPTPTTPIPINVVSGDNSIVVCGKNLFEIKTPDYTGQDAWASYGQSDYTKNNNGYMLNQRYVGIAFQFNNLKIGSQYTISFNVVGNSSFWASVGINVYSGHTETNTGSKDFYVETTTSRITYTFTASSNNRIAFNSGYTNNTILTISNIQLEKGSSATTYEEFQGINTYSINLGSLELCKIGTYQDYFYKDSGKWYLHKEIKKRILNGEETYSVAATPSGRTVFLLNDQRSETYHSNSIVVILSTHLEGISDNQGNLLNSIRANNSGQIFITTSSDYPDVATFKTFLSANNITFYYILATPTNTQITYQPLLEQLNLLEKAQSKENQTNISQVNNDLPFIISASALKEWQENTSLNSTLSMVSPLSLGNTLNTQENNTQPIEVDNIEPLEEEENEES